MRNTGLLVGALLISGGEFLSFVHILPWSQFVFPMFWYGYIAVLDGLNLRFHGFSLISDRPKEFLFMLPVSALYWYIFEGYNVVIQNWTYVNVSSERWLEIALRILSFATVIPAVYETGDLFVGFTWSSRHRSAKGRIPRGWSILSLVVGSFFCVLPLLWPKFFFWSLWLGLFFLLDPLNNHLGRASILRDWQLRELRRTHTLLAAGYTCGFFWEFWNYWAYTKWVYSVPIPEMPRIFEMPALGFLGFGPFALETFSFWTFVWGERRKDLRVGLRDRLS